ncbi:MAG: hypothetical protein CMF38_08285 [Legionellaceae bacterium]|nr:hypothetical protein [Legionellaceae bacterium]|tara:strand:+ start:3413 stop:4735 length:1323 start_codon:yes stop_codon:yes gene_type:complete
MYTKCLDILAKLRSSYWYIPLLLAFLALLLAILTLRLDKLFVWHWLTYVGWFHANNPEGARVILSTIAGSMISVAGVSFSITMVAIAFAGSQVGPRLTSNFMRDKVNQLTLGMMVATFLYCLFILLALFNANKTGTEITENLTFIPQISLLTAVLFCISSIIILIYFFHHVPDSINMSNVVARVGQELNQQLTHLFPHNIGYEQETLPSFERLYGQKTLIKATESGYVRLINGQHLFNLAKKHDLIVKFQKQSGDFVTKGTILLEIYAKQTLTDQVEKACKNIFVLGINRNQEQDPLFLVDELVEIIGRALSPGVNDPFTAIGCFNWLTLSIQTFLHVTLPSPYRYDEHQQLRLIAYPIEFKQLCELVFARVHAYVAKDRNAAMHMMDMLIQLYDSANCTAQKKLLANYADALKRATSTTLLAEDATQISQIYQQKWQTS